MPHSELDVDSTAKHEDLATLAKGGGIALFGRLSSRGLQLVIQILLARLLGPAAYGLYSIGWNVFQIGSRIGPLGLQNGVVHFGARFHKHDVNRFRQIVWLSVGTASVIGALSALIIAIGAPFLAIQVFRDANVTGILRGFAAALGFGIVLRVTSSASRITYRMQFSAIAEDLVPYAGNLLLILVLVAVGALGLMGAVKAVLLSHVAGWVISMVFLLRLFPSLKARIHIEWQVGLELLRYSLPVFLAGVFTFLIMWSTALLVGIFMTSKDVGIFQVASQASLLGAVILGGIRLVFAPMSSTLYHENEYKRLERAYSNNTRLGIYLSLPLMLFTLAAPQHVIGALFGPEYLSGASSLVILVLAQLVSAGSGGVDYLLVMTGHQRDWFCLTLFAFLASVLSNIALIPRMGIVGAAVANSLGIVCLYLGGLFLVRRRLRLWPLDGRFFRALVPFIVASVITAYLQRARMNSGPLDLILLIIIEMLIAYGGLWVVTPYTEDREIVGQFLARIGEMVR